MIRFARALFISAFAFLASFAAFAADTVDASGTWQFTIQDTGRVFTPSFLLKQDGNKLTGTYKNSQGDNPASGMVNGNQVTLNAQIKGRDGEPRTVTYIGTINGDTMTGKMETTRAEVTFTATRQPTK